MSFGWEIPACLSVQAGSDQKGTLQPFLLIVVGFLAQTLEKVVCVSFLKAVNCIVQERGFDEDQFLLHSKDLHFPNA